MRAPREAPATRRKRLEEKAKRTTSQLDVKEAAGRSCRGNGADERTENDHEHHDLHRIAVGDDEAAETGIRRELAHAGRPVLIQEQQECATERRAGEALQQTFEHERK